MARIPNEQIERLKQEVSIQRLAESAGVELKRHGADLLGRCPFHDDKTPSLVISPAKNLWHCLGACNTGGSVIDWVMKANGVSFRHAAELLKADLPSLVASPSAVKRSSVRHLDAPFTVDADDRAALAQVFGYYHETLKQSPRRWRIWENAALPPVRPSTISSWATPTARWLIVCRRRRPRRVGHCADGCSG